MDCPWGGEPTAFLSCPGKPAVSFGGHSPGHFHGVPRRRGLQGSRRHQQPRLPSAPGTALPSATELPPVLSGSQSAAWLTPASGSLLVQPTDARPKLSDSLWTSSLNSLTPSWSPTLAPSLRGSTLRRRAPQVWSSSCLSTRISAHLVILQAIHLKFMGPVLSLSSQATCPWLHACYEKPACLFLPSCLTVCKPPFEWYLLYLWSVCIWVLSCWSEH